MKKIRVALIGYGYWGPNLARNILLNKDYELICIVDTDADRTKLADASHGVKVYNSISRIESLEQMDLAVIATGPASHKDLVEFFATQGVNCLVTKPITAGYYDALEVQALADRHGIKVYCDFTYHFSPLINFLLSDARATNIICNMKEYVSYRTSLGIIQSDVDVVADLAVHDIYILKLIKGSLPNQVKCISLGLTPEIQVQSAFISLKWLDGFNASIHVSWKSPKKMRFMSIVSDSDGIVVEEMNQSTPIQIISISPEFSNSVNLPINLVKSRNESYTIGQIESPVIERVESLTTEFKMLSEAINSKNSTFPNILDAVGIWSVVEAIRKSISRDGTYIDVT